jgi:hypothetical protein
MDYNKLSKTLLTKLEDVFELTIKINIGINEIAALCDLRASVSTTLTAPHNPSHK